MTTTRCKKGHLSHREWVKCQKLKPTFRDVLLHTSLIESAIISESEKIKPLSKKEKLFYRSFGNSITILDKNTVVDIYNLNKERNKLIHDIFRRKLNQDQIEKTRDKMFELINKIRKESKIIKKYI